MQGHEAPWARDLGDGGRGGRHLPPGLLESRGAAGLDRPRTGRDRHPDHDETSDLGVSNTVRDGAGARAASELRHVVVYLKDAPSRLVPATKVEIHQRDENFIPRVVAVPIGSEV